jgi:hypothetical protein
MDAIPPEMDEDDDMSSNEDTEQDKMKKYSFVEISAELNFGDKDEDMKDDLEILAEYASHANKWYRETAMKNLYCFVCMLAMEGVTTEFNRTRLKELWFLAHTNFNAVLELYPKKEKSKTTLRFFPNETWPDNLKRYV